MPGYGVRIAVFLMMTILVVIGWARLAGADAPLANRARVEAALSNIRTLARPGQIALATVWDGNKYVQCRRAPDDTLFCEAAGALMQPSLGRVLTPERVGRLTALGWRVDLAFGNYVQTFPSGVSAGEVADKILHVLAESYAANLADLEVRTDWVKSEPCPPRNGPTQNLAGMINDAPSMRRYAIHACRYDPGPDAQPAAVVHSAGALIEVYAPTVIGEVQRLKVNTDRRVFFALETGAGYVQCESQRQSVADLYCEAQSADSWEVLSRILTPDRVMRLHAAGYADPGRGPNYSKIYPAQGAAAEIADELLTILYDVYGYNGQPKLKVSTEKGRY